MERTVAAQMRGRDGEVLRRRMNPPHAVRVVADRARDGMHHVLGDVRVEAEATSS